MRSKRVTSLMSGIPGCQVFFESPECVLRDRRQPLDTGYPKLWRYHQIPYTASGPGNRWTGCDSKHAKIAQPSMEFAAHGWLTWLTTPFPGPLQRRSDAFLRLQVCTCLERKGWSGGRICKHRCAVFVSLRQWPDLADCIVKHTTWLKTWSTLDSRL